MTDVIESAIGPFFGLEFGRPSGSPRLPQSWRFQSHKDATARSGARVSDGKARSGRILDRSTSRTRNTARAGDCDDGDVVSLPVNGPVLSAPRLH